MRRLIQPLIEGRRRNSSAWSRQEHLGRHFHAEGPVAPTWHQGDDLTSSCERSPSHVDQILRLRTSKVAFASRSRHRHFGEQCANVSGCQRLHEERGHDRPIAIACSTHNHFGKLEELSRALDYE
jgi:hypothetical protein